MYDLTEEREEKHMQGLACSLNVEEENLSCKAFGCEERGVSRKGQ